MSGVTWLRFMPDYGAALALWYLDANDLDGHDRGLASDLRPRIEPQLYADIESWIEDWSSWHDCDNEESPPPKQWTQEGERLVERLREQLEPLGYRIQDRLR
jgi:hypothetical protein